MIYSRGFEDLAKELSGLNKQELINWVEGNSINYKDALFVLSCSDNGEIYFFSQGSYFKINYFKNQFDACGYFKSNREQILCAFGSLFGINKQNELYKTIMLYAFGDYSASDFKDSISLILEENEDNMSVYDKEHLNNLIDKSFLNNFSRFRYTDYICESY